MIDSKSAQRREIQRRHRTTTSGNERILTAQLCDLRISCRLEETGVKTVRMCTDSAGRIRSELRFKYRNFAVVYEQNCIFFYTGPDNKIKNINMDDDGRLPINV